MTAKNDPRNPSPETRAKISAAVKARYRTSTEYRARNKTQLDAARIVSASAYKNRAARIADLEAENQQLRDELLTLRGGGSR